MNSLLVIDSSVLGEGSVSRELVKYTVERLLKDAPQAQVTYRDLGERPVPHLTAKTVMGVVGQPANEAERTSHALSDELIGELKSADTIVIGAPMYNFSVATGLRAWLDHVLRAGQTFSYTAEGPRGHLGGKRVIVIESRGGLYSEGPAAAIDFQEPYLRHLLGFMGLTDVTFVRAEKIGHGPQARAEALEQARRRIDALAAPSLSQAA